MRQINIYTDGSYSPVTGFGGWAAVLLPGNGIAYELSDGCDVDCSALRMEMLAIIKALEHLNHPAKVLVHTDSSIVVDAMRYWMPRWKLNGWVNGNGQSITNRDLWDELDYQCDVVHHVVFNWLRGHTGHKYNERADHLARIARQRIERIHRNKLRREIT